MSIKRKGKRAEETSQAMPNRQAGIDSTSGAQQEPFRSFIATSSSRRRVPQGTCGSVCGIFSGRAPYIYWKEAKDTAAKHPTMHRMSPSEQRSIQPKMLIMLTWGNHVLLYL